MFWGSFWCLRGCVVLHMIGYLNAYVRALCPLSGSEWCSSLIVAFPGELLFNSLYFLI